MCSQSAKQACSAIKERTKKADQEPPQDLPIATDDDISLFLSEIGPSHDSTILREALTSLQGRELYVLARCVGESHVYRANRKRLQPSDLHLLADKLAAEAHDLQARYPNQFDQTWLINHARWITRQVKCLTFAAALFTAAGDDNNTRRAYGNDARGMRTLAQHVAVAKTVDFAEANRQVAHEAM
ncbi:hypothetical protein C5Y96_26025, partial [Blastopirellula marina]